MNTTIKKDAFLGWYAETLFHIKDNIYFIVSTCKRHSGVSSSGRVWNIDPQTGSRSTMIYGDDIATNMRHDVKRAAEKAIKEAHTFYINSNEVESAVKSIREKKAA